jgi:hypothetical protein
MLTGALIVTFLGLGALDAEAMRFYKGRGADLGLVHGIDGEGGFPVDIVVWSNFRKLPLDDVTFGTAVNVNDLEPGFIRPGWAWVGVFAGDAFGNGRRDRPILSKFVYVRRGSHQTIAAYVEADAAGAPIGPTIASIDTDVTPLEGLAGVEVSHLAVAPEVSVCANGALDLTEGGFVNGETVGAAVPANTYDVTVTAPGDCATVLAGPLSVGLESDVNTLAFAIGVFPQSFQVVTIQVPVRSRRY